jgi:membrane protein insertase Oxa1/YidC/SpoIIIJ
MLNEFKGVSEAQYNAVMGGLISRTAANYNGWLILPLLAGLTSWWQTKITMPPQTAQANPSQSKNPLGGKTMQYIFPAISLFFTASSNSVFALYWISSNLVSIATYKGVDIVWKLRAERKEAEEKAKLEEAGRTAALKPAEAEAKKLPEKAGAAQPAAAKGKTNPKEGMKQ